MSLNVEPAPPLLFTPFQHGNVTGVVESFEFQHDHYSSRRRTMKVNLLCYIDDLNFEDPTGDVVEVVKQVVKEVDRKFGQVGQRRFA